MSVQQIITDVQHAAETEIIQGCAGDVMDWVRQMRNEFAEIQNDVRKVYWAKNELEKRLVWERINQFKVNVLNSWWYQWYCVRQDQQRRAKMWHNDDMDKVILWFFIVKIVN